MTYLYVTRKINLVSFWETECTDFAVSNQCSSTFACVGRFLPEINKFPLPVLMKYKIIRNGSYYHTKLNVLKCA